ncbi:paxneb protein [Hortaea werneckii]|nr:paxneb protein [Hortaea werneckii]
MAFRKRNVAVGKGSGGDADGVPATVQTGVRPSSLTSSHPVISTGSSSLDEILGGHAGLALGSSLLIEESGTTDFSGALLKYYAAEGICHGHAVHVVGMGDGWIRDLPAAAEEKGSRRSSASSSSGSEDKMKIAWRYEKLGQTGDRAPPSPRSHPDQNDPNAPQIPFCHTFDLTKRLTIPPTARINHIPLKSPTKPFESIIPSLDQAIQTLPPGTLHRLVIPTVLSPALWPPTASRPENFLHFLHSLQALLQKHPTRLTAMLTLPLELQPRSSGLTRWAELFSDGVLELTPFPHLMDASRSSGLAESGGARAGKDEQPQGMLKVHKLPITTARGEGGAGPGNTIGEDLAFTVSRRKFEIRPFSHPWHDQSSSSSSSAALLEPDGADFVPETGGKGEEGEEEGEEDAEEDGEDE